MGNSFPASEDFHMLSCTLIFLAGLWTGGVVALLIVAILGAGAAQKNGGRT